MTYRPISAAALVLLTAAAVACSQAPAAPSVTPVSVQDVGAAGDTPMKINAPVSIWPVGGELVEDDDPDLLIGNASARFVDNLALSYIFEVFNENNQPVYRSVPIPAGPNGRTEHEIGVHLDFDKNYSWHAFVVYQDTAGPVSARGTFKTFSPFGPSCAFMGTEEGIVLCRRAQFGFMDQGERVEFLRRVAYDLNRLPAEHAPYGILHKTTGHNCFGYSCDVICSNAGGQHRQWDTLLDEDATQGPQWSRIPEVAVRPCEIIQ